MTSHAHRNPFRGIVEHENWMFWVIRCHKNTLLLWIICNSPEAGSAWGLANLGQSPGFWLKGPEGFRCRAEEAVFVCASDSAKRLGSIKLRQRNFTRRPFVQIDF